MNAHFVSVAVLLVVACGAAGCEPPRNSAPTHVALLPEAEHVAINDNRSIEHCSALGFVSAATSRDALGRPRANFLEPTLMNHTSERGGNYIEALPVQCQAGSCTQTGMAYRCPNSSS